MTVADWLRLLGPPLVAAYRALRTLRSVPSKPDYRGRVIAAVPMIAALDMSHALGEALGYMTGSGDASLRVH